MAVGKNYNPLSKKTVSFDTLALTIKTCTDDVVAYKIYQDATRFYIIHARTVAEALQKSPIEKPFKIVKTNVVDKDFFTRSELSENEESYDRQRKKPNTVLAPPKSITLAQALMKSAPAG
jgi:hypothetical protein